MVAPIVAETVVRTLLQDQPSPDDTNGSDTPPEEDFRTETKNLRIAGVLIILAAGLLGSIPPLLIKSFRTPGHSLPRIIRAISAGIILALGCIHILPDAVLDMDTLTPFMGDYPYNAAGVCAVFGVLLMVAMDTATHTFLDKRAKAEVQAANVSAALALGLPPSEAHLYKPNNNTHPKLSPAPLADSLEDGANQDTRYIRTAEPPIRDKIVQPTARDQTVVFLFEFGCVFHSVIIGLALGVTSDNMQQVRALLIALCFHQWLEGAALGSFITRAQLPVWKGMLMVIIYSLTCPAGVAIGIGVAETYDPESTKAAAIQGVFNGVSAGMLLYVALVQLIAEDFNTRELSAAHHLSAECDSELQHQVGNCTRVNLCNEGNVEPAKGWLMVALHLCLWLGAAMMAVLAIWA